MSDKKPIDLLGENVQSFVESFEQKFTDSIKCKEGCSACCYTDLSVFTVESDKVVNWFLTLDEARKAELKNLWAQENAEGACTFLYNDRCSIYEVRPIICRSHGVLVQYQEDEKKKYDICPLNETEETIAATDQALDLDRLNTLISIAEKDNKQAKERTKLRYLKTKLMEFW